MANRMPRSACQIARASN